MNSLFRPSTACQQQVDCSSIITFSVTDPKVSQLTELHPKVRFFCKLAPEDAGGNTEAVAVGQILILVRRNGAQLATLNDWVAWVFILASSQNTNSKDFRNWPALLKDFSDCSWGWGLRHDWVILCKRVTSFTNLCLQKKGFGYRVRKNIFFMLNSVECGLSSLLHAYTVFTFCGGFVVVTSSAIVYQQAISPES